MSRWPFRFAFCSRHCNRLFPGKLGAENKAKYQSAGIKWIFQGGEKHEMTGMSYTSCANHAANMNVEGTRVVSCNTTGLSRTLVPLYEHCGELSVECTMIRRAADPGDSKKGPINAIKPVLKVPSHHGPDVMTVKPEIKINSLAVAVPTTIMHVHSIVATLPEGHNLSTESVLEMWSNCPRVVIMNGAETELQQLQKSWNSLEIWEEHGVTCMRYSFGKMGSNWLVITCIISKQSIKNLMLFQKTLMRYVR